MRLLARAAFLPLQHVDFALFGHGEPVNEDAGQLAVYPFGPGGTYTSP